MKTDHPTGIDRMGAVYFTILIGLFLIVAFLHNSFFNWAYARHQNQISWYIRPLFLIPFCYFSYVRKRSGITGTVFFLLTSMFWFPKPETVSMDVQQFLQFEKDWLQGSWTVQKSLLASLVPLSFTLLAVAFWKRSVASGLAVLVLMALGKMIWAVNGAGKAGMSIIVPAVTGLLICCLLVYFSQKKLARKK